MEKQPLHVCRSLFNRLSKKTSVEVTAILRLYLENQNSNPPSQLIDLVSHQFSRLLMYNHQIENRMMEDLLACLPYLGIYIGIV